LEEPKSYDFSYHRNSRFPDIKILHSVAPSRVNTLIWEPLFTDTGVDDAKLPKSTPAQGNKIGSIEESVGCDWGLCRIPRTDLRVIGQQRERFF